LTNMHRKSYCKEMKLDNKFFKYYKKWYGWHLFRLEHNLQHRESAIWPPKWWRGQDLRCGLSNFIIESVELPGAQIQLVSTHDSRPGNDCSIEDDWLILIILYFEDIFNSIQFLFANLPCQVHYSVKAEDLPDLEYYWTRNITECKSNEHRWFVMWWSKSASYWDNICTSHPCVQQVPTWLIYVWQ
jgi:hypothetical protein